MVPVSVSIFDFIVCSAFLFIGGIGIWICVLLVGGGGVVVAIWCVHAAVLRVCVKL